MKLEIVSHCWQYARLLTYQLSSLVLNPVSQLQVLHTVMCAPRSDDSQTWRVLDFFQQHTPPASVEFRWWVLDTPQLFRRAIGRNLAATQTTADWVWFADCDMVFGEGAIDSLATTLANCAAILTYPRTVLINKTHELGDLAIERANEPQILAVQDEEFCRTRYNRAIGGVQIVCGTTARSLGYCQGTGWQTPVKQWMRAREDRAYRRILGTGGTPIHIPNLYRLRHSKRGCDHPGVVLNQ